ncbi:MAG: YdcF family protein [Cyanobacteria bacterium RM1_2_2]|nr:YdcF family protein [Cyanobacteria bacterium RM1_2_2]
MFLFLSKLLPLFVYPLGFACLMLIGALLTLWKRPRWSAGFIILALAALLLGGNGWIANQMVSSLEQQSVPTANLPNADAIVVLGGAIRPQIPPRPGVDVTEAGDRPIYGAQLYREGKAPLVILSGGRIEWQGGGPPESADMAKLIETMGVPAAAILQDPTSLNTHENAVNVKQILTQRGINRVLLVTSAAHMPRSVAIFKKQGIDATPAPTDFLVTQQELQEAQSTSQGRILSVIPEAENLQRLTRALKEYIGILIYRLRGWA